MAERFILSVKYSVSTAPSNGARAVRGFLKYIEHRDKHIEHRDKHKDTQARKTEGLLRYVAYRDRTTTRGQLFGRDGRAGDVERKELAAHVKRSLSDVRPIRHGRPARSVYRMVLSPERADGLDLQELARSAMRQLEKDVGQLPPWIAAVHRNTAHPHVHIVLAARREIAPGRFRELVITKDRLAHMKAATGLELSLQRGERRPERALEPARSRPFHHYIRPDRDDAALGVLGGLLSGLQRAALMWRRQLERDYEQHMRERGLGLGMERGGR